MEHLKYQSRYIEESINLWGTAASVMMRLGIFLIGAWMSVSGYGVTPGIVLVFLQLMNYVISPIERIPSIWQSESRDWLIEKNAGKCADQSGANEGKQNRNAEKRNFVEGCQCQYRQQECSSSFKL